MIEAFIQEASGTGPARQWIYGPGFKIYLRIGRRRFIEDGLMLTLEIANIEVHAVDRRKGIFKELMQRCALALLAREDHARWCIYLENVQNPALVAYLEREGWTRREAYLGDWAPSFYARPEMVVRL